MLASTCIRRQPDLLPLRGRRGAGVESDPDTEASLRRWFRSRPESRVLLECGSSSRWVARLLRELGVQVVVVNARRIRLIAETTLKTDKIDAEVPARLGRRGS